VLQERTEVKTAMSVVTCMYFLSASFCQHWQIKRVQFLGNDIHKCSVLRT